LKYAYFQGSTSRSDFKPEAPPLRQADWEDCDPL
jgi:hypothetical protein